MGFQREPERSVEEAFGPSRRFGNPWGPMGVEECALGWDGVQRNAVQREILELEGGFVADMTIGFLSRKEVLDFCD